MSDEDGVSTAMDTTGLKELQGFGKATEEFKRNAQIEVAMRKRLGGANMKELNEELSLDSIRQAYIKAGIDEGEINKLMRLTTRFYESRRATILIGMISNTDRAIQFADLEILGNEMSLASIRQSYVDAGLNEEEVESLMISAEEAHKRKLQELQ